MDKPQKINLPTKEISVLLDKSGLETTWKQLVLTHAKKSYPEITSKLITASNEFQNITLLPEDYLNQLSIGQIGILYEYSLSYVNPESRKQSGQYFTPDDIAKWMAKQSKKFSKGIWLDPSSGIGNLSYYLAKQQTNPEKFIVNQLILSDKNALALLIARVLFTLHFHKDNSNLFEDLKPRMVEQDFLETTQGLPSKIAQLKPDYVIVNPPYAPHKDIRWDTSQARDLYAYFLEVIVKNVKGFISVTPQSYTNGEKFSTLRKLIIDNFNNIDIYNFDNIPDSIFKGIKFGSTNTNTANSVRASIMIAQKTTPNNALTRITPLLRWGRAERSTMLQTVETKLAQVTLTENVFPKNYEGLTKLYEEILSNSWEPLHKILSPYPTEYALTVPTTPRYYITATKRTLNRSSYQTLYFNNETDLNKIYVYLNSSIMYWWWRVNDGGMTLSTKTLLTLPVNNKLKTYPSLIKQLEDSEKNNLVIKMNAGKGQENVKHPPNLIQTINEQLFSKTVANKLFETHKNTNF